LWGIHRLLHRFARTCTVSQVFVNNAIGMLSRLLYSTNGYSKRKLAQYFYQFGSSRIPSLDGESRSVPHSQGWCHRHLNTGCIERHILVCIERFAR